MEERNRPASDDLGEMLNDVTDANQALSQFFGTAREVLDRYNHCVLCGANLHFSHQTDFTRNLTHEIAKCPECQIKVRRMVHKLQ